MSADKPAISLQDAEPDAWRAEKRPDIDPDLLQLCAAHDRLKAAQAAIDGHQPPYAGPVWGQKTQAYSVARADLEQLFERIKGSVK